MPHGYIKSAYSFNTVKFAPFFRFYIRLEINVLPLRPNGVLIEAERDCHSASISSPFGLDRNAIRP